MAEQMYKKEEGGKATEADQKKKKADEDVIDAEIE
jgi:molecular chaperone DnaK